MIRFTDRFGRVVEYERRYGVQGDKDLVELIHETISEGLECGCDFWSPIEPSLDSDWEAYLTICGAIARATLLEPKVDRVPVNPAGYVPEGPVF